MVPKTFVENLQFRIDLRKRAEGDPQFQAVLMEACRRDVLFFFSAFCFLHEPRPMFDNDGNQLPEIIPFIPWPHQEGNIRTIRENLGHRDIGVEKARGEGMSWIAIMLALHDWIFALPGQRMVIIGLVSRTMEMADTPDDMNSLMPKLDWQLQRLPKWMVGEDGVDYKRLAKDHTLRNLRNNSLIAAYASTGEVGSGGRYTWFFLDELSKFPAGNDTKALTSTQQATKSRLIVGTPYGSEGAYYKVMHEPSSMIKLYLKWEDNPTRNQGLYRMVKGVPVAEDPINNPLPPDYMPPSQEVLDMFDRLRKNGFRLDKGLRSPWYDKECDRPDATPYNIAQELDRDYGGSMFKIFTEDFFTAASETTRAPFSRVHVHYDEDLNPHVTKANDGTLSLWMPLDQHNRPSGHTYVLGVDICTGLAGTYTSNSVIQIIDALTMEQVGEFASSTLPPDKLADLCVAICRWLGDAYLAWERNGPGAAFTVRIKEIGYPNVYMRTKLFAKQVRKKVKEPGWWTDAKSKEVLFSELRRIVAIKELKIHSSATVEECHQYVRLGRAIEHVGSARADKEGPDQGESHGDRVIALGIAVQALRDRPAKIEHYTTSRNAIEPNSIEERDLIYYESLKEDAGDDWDDRTNWDMMESV